MSPDPPDLETAVDRIDLLIDLDRHADAERESRDLIGREPEAWQAYAALARALVAQDRYEEGIAACRAALSRSPDEELVHFIAGAALGDLGRLDEAAEAAAEVIRLDPDWSCGYHLMAAVESRRGRFQEGRAAALAGLRLDPIDQELLYEKGWIDKQLGDYAEAVRTGEDGLAHHPNSTSLRSMVAAAKQEWAWRCVRPGSAVALYRQADGLVNEAIRLRPGDATYHVQRRGNVIAWRSYLLRWVVLAVALTAAVVTGVMAWAGTPVAVVFGLMVGAGMAAGAAAFLLRYSAGPRWDGFPLFVPARLLGVPVVPVTRRERVVGAALWAAVTVLLVLPPAAAVLAGQWSPP